MFPLGIVHFPFVPLPLQVFEPRYRQLTIDCLDGSREFGVVLIERGSEVGGGDQRFAVGTMTVIVDAGFNDMGMIRLDTVGVRRVQITEWLADDPYPRAIVEDLPAATPADTAGFGATEVKVRRALALRAELNEVAVPFNIALDPDPTRSMYQLAAIAPIGPADKQSLLAAAPAAMLGLLDGLIDEELDVLASRLAGH